MSIYMGTPYTEDQFSRDKLSLEALQGVVTHTASCKKRRQEREYVGPVSDSVFRRLVHLPGKSLAVYLILLQRWRIYLWECRKYGRKEEFTLSGKLLRDYGIDAHTKARSIAALESAGLITVERRPRKNPIVTLLQEKPCP
jgi:hypothetical protein